MKKKFVWLVASGLMVLALLAAACAPAPAKEIAPTAPAAKEAAPAVPAVKEAAPAVKEAPRYGGVLNISQSGAIQNWDEAYCAPWTLANPLEVINEELLQGNWSRGPAGTGEVSWNMGAWMRLDFMEGMLAESWEFTDPVTAIFHIRKGVRWTLDPNREASRLVNGREVIAADIVWNLKRILWEIKTSTMYGWVGVSRPTEIYAPDKYTVVVKSPPGEMGMMFEVVADHVRIMAPEVGKKYGDFQAWENSVGTGPFMVKDYVAMSSVTYVRNPNYWGKDPVGLGKGNQLPYLDSLKLLIIPDLSTRLAAIRTGKIGHSEALMPEDALQLKKTSPELNYIRQLTRTNTLAMRQDKPELPFKDIRVRRALAMAIDNEAIKNNYYLGEAEILAWKIPPTPEFKVEFTPLEQIPLAADGFDTRKLYGYYPEEAKKLLAEAGYPNGFKSTIDVTPSGNYGPDVYLIVKEYWKKNLNVDVELIVREAPIHESMRIRKTHGPMFAYGRTYSPYQMPSCRTNNAWNSSMSSDPKLDAYYSQLNALYFEPDKAAKLMKEVNLYIIERADYWPPPAPYTYVFWHSWLKNYYGVTGLGAWNTRQELKYVWLDQELKKKMGY